VGLLSEETLKRHLEELRVSRITWLRRREYAEEVQQAFPGETEIYEDFSVFDRKTYWVVRVKGGHEYDDSIAAVRKLAERLPADPELQEALREVRATIAYLAREWSDCLKDALGVPSGQEPRESLRNLIKAMEEED
jgi:hypothetical protein